MSFNMRCSSAIESFFFLFFFHFMIWTRAFWWFYCNFVIFSLISKLCSLWMATFDRWTFASNDISLLPNQWNKFPLFFLFPSNADEDDNAKESLEINRMMCGILFIVFHHHHARQQNRCLRRVCVLCWSSFAALFVI